MRTQRTLGTAHIATNCPPLTDAARMTQQRECGKRQAPDVHQTVRRATLIVSILIDTVTVVPK